MSSRLCGYCRLAGHTFPKCPTVHEERRNILIHVPQQRLLAIQGLARLGLGIGAMIQREDWYEKEHIGVIDSFDWIKYANFYEAKHIKYSKKVKIVPLFISQHYTYRRLNVQYVGMGNGSAGHRNVGVHITRSLAAIDGRTIDGYGDDFKVVAPSNTIEFDPEILVENISLPRRLWLNDQESNGVRGVMPAGI